MGSALPTEESQPDSQETEQLRTGMKESIGVFQETRRDSKPAEPPSKEDQEFAHKERALKLALMESQVSRQEAMTRAVNIENRVNTGLGIALGTLSVLGVVLGIMGLRPPK